MQLEDEKATTPFDAGVDWLVLGDEAAPEDEEPFAAFVEEHVDALQRFAAAVAHEPERAPGFVAAALATAYRHWRDITEGDERPLVEVAGILARRIWRLQAHQAEVEARRQAWRSGWDARPEGLGSDEDEGPGAVHALFAEVHVRLDALTHLRRRRRGRGRLEPDAVRAALDRMMPEDRLAGTLHEVLGLDEREVGRALRIPWLHAVARIARAEVRGPELLADAGISATLGEAVALLGSVAAPPAEPVPRLPDRVRRRARWTAVGSGTAVAAVIGLLAVALPSLAGHGSAPPPALPASGAAGSSTQAILPVFAAASGRGVARLPCPAFPPEPAHPIYHGPPVPGSALLNVDDFALPGTSWTRLRGSYIPALPTPVVDGVDPVLPFSQAAAIADTLVAEPGAQVRASQPPSSVVRQIVMRYDRTTGALAARRLARQLQCHDSRHTSRLLQRQDGRTITVRAYGQSLLPAAGATRRTQPFDTWLLLVRSNDVITVLSVRGDLAVHASPAGSAALVAVALSRLEGHLGDPFS